MKHHLLAAVGAFALLNPALALAQQTTPTPAASPPAPGSIAMVRVEVSDMARSEAFYSAVFGMSVMMRPNAHEHIMMSPGSTTMLVLATADHAGAAAPKEGVVGFGFNVPDLEAVMQRAVAAGGTIAEPIGPLHYDIRTGILRDPDGALIEAYQHMRKTAP